MVSFRETLREYIKKNGYSINEFANKCNIDRAWLSNVLSGRKELSEAKFKNIIESNILSEVQNENLTSLYRLRDYAPEQIERIEYMLERLSRKVRRTECFIPIDFDDDRQIYIGKENLLSALFKILAKREEISDTLPRSRFTCAFCRRRVCSRPPGRGGGARQPWTALRRCGSGRGPWRQRHADR